ncbi:host cell factor 2-like isoform X1 [Periplaneta americana]|uniref:host cell factor 2-like isoform X1 n=1 Tax=Periplaneta americana TaxID=6978 RepID=UPI0037E7DD9E
MSEKEEFKQPVSKELEKSSEKEEFKEPVSKKLKESSEKEEFKEPVSKKLQESSEKEEFTRPASKKLKKSSEKEEFKHSASKTQKKCRKHGKEKKNKRAALDSEKDSHQIAAPGTTKHWHDVGIFKSTSTSVSSFCVKPQRKDVVQKDDEAPFTSKRLAEISLKKRIQLEPGAAYKFRVAAVNSCGRSPWSDVSVFETCPEGTPEIISGVEIYRTVVGVRFRWKALPTKAGESIEYSIYLAVRAISGIIQEQNYTMVFVPVYCGRKNEYVLPMTLLSIAYLDDSTTEPAFLIKVVARNKVGYGPCCKVKWFATLDFRQTVRKALEWTERQHHNIIG